MSETVAELVQFLDDESARLEGQLPALFQKLGEQFLANEDRTQSWSVQSPKKDIINRRERQQEIRNLKGTLVVEISKMRKHVSPDHAV